MTLGGEKQRYATIRKDLSLLNPRPNMIDYVRTKASAIPSFFTQSRRFD